ncbi:MAG: ribbon-helix-helix protein, CopG family [Sphingopyxis sp.]|nr:ribbon-helix-helix protein, CopG family [Sphingopyxis sp.]
MSKHAVISARIDPETLATVDRIAAEQGRSRAWFVANAVKQVAEQESRFAAFVKAGRADIAAGRVVDNNIVLTMLDEMIAAHEARCQG